MLGLTVVFIALAGISAYIVMNKSGDDLLSGNDDALDAVIEELTKTVSDDLPDYALNSKKMQAGYLVALQMPDVLERMPCYCSCGAVGHKSLRDCFLEGGDGFEEHASYCDLCVNEALDVYTWQKQGLNLQEIRSRIDEKYSRYGEPTDTPEV
jgi:hypothetical protein